MRVKPPVSVTEEGVDITCQRAGTYGDDQVVVTIEEDGFASLELCRFAHPWCVYPSSDRRLCPSPLDRLPSGRWPTPG